MSLKTLLGNLSLRYDVLKLTDCQRGNKDKSVSTLKVFKESEIIFNEEEAREILIQFFHPIEIKLRWHLSQLS